MFWVDKNIDHVESLIFLRDGKSERIISSREETHPSARRVSSREAIFARARVIRSFTIPKKNKGLRVV